MERKTLIQYLDILIDLEKNVFIQQNAIDTFRSEIQKLKEKRSFEEPTAPEQEPFKSGYIYGALACLFVGLSLLFWGISLTQSMPTGIFSGFLLGLFTLFILIVSACLLIAFIALPIKGIRDYFSSSKTYKANYENYLDALDAYDQNIEAERQQAEQNAFKIAAYEHEMKLLIETNHNTKSALTKIYSANIIFPKYQSLPFLCSIQEYILSKRAVSLGDAYNLLESEIRMEIIIIKLDTIISRLDQISKNQYMLYQALDDANKKLDSLITNTHQLSEKICSLHQYEQDNLSRISHSVEQIKKDSSAIVYYQERTSKELEYMNWMNYISGDNDSTTFNIPPSV